MNFNELRDTLLRAERGGVPRFSAEGKADHEVSVEGARYDAALDGWPSIALAGG